jgi:3-oxoacyl-[acyl-carrier protein] reductase
VRDTYGDALLFGATGAIGSAVGAKLSSLGFNVTKVVRHKTMDPGSEIVVGMPEALSSQLSTLNRKFSAVVWAHGVNQNDSVLDVDLTSYENLMDVNVGYVLNTLSILARENLLSSPSRLCVISSVWEQIARSNKISYTISKAALGGLVRAAANDLASRNILINGVLPGVVDTPMTRQILSIDQVNGVKESTGFGRLVTVEDIAATVGFLCSPDNNGITGQSITVDLGFSNARRI